MGTDTAWALKLKEAVDTAARQLRVQVISAKPSSGASATQADADMLFELDTDKGRVLATRQRSGNYIFTWL